MQSIDTIPRSPYGSSLPDETLLAEAIDVRTVDVAKGVQIGYTLLNKQLIGEASPIVAIGGFMSDVTSPDGAWEGVQLATLKRPVLMLDIPGHGLSSPNDKRQIIDLCIRRKSDSHVAPLVEAVQLLLNPNDELDYFGISHGGHLSLKATELDPGDRVGTVLGIDIPAVKRRFTLGLQAGYIVADNLIGRKKYLEELQGTDFLRDFEEFKIAFEQKESKRADSFIKNNTGLFLLNLVASINARPVALESWQTIMDTKSAKVVAVTSENGHVSDPAAIEAFIEGLAEGHKERSSQVVIGGEDHNLSIVHLMPRAVEWAKTAYKS